MLRLLPDGARSHAVKFGKCEVFKFFKTNFCIHFVLHILAKGTGLVRVKVGLVALALALCPHYDNNDYNIQSYNIQAGILNNLSGLRGSENGYFRYNSTAICLCPLHILYNVHCAHNVRQSNTIIIIFLLFNRDSN